MTDATSHTSQIHQTTPALVLAVNEAQYKAHTMDHEPTRYLLSSAVAGALIALILAVCLKMGQVLFAGKVAAYYVPVSAFFGVALSTIIICKVELFTSNIMYLTFGRLAGVANTRQMLQSWLMVYLGNALGIAVFAWVFMSAHAWGTVTAEHLLFNVVQHKVEASFAAIFWKGVLCNWVICLAVWVPLKLSNEVAKILMTLCLVFVFFFSGFEHSIANMAFFALAWVYGGLDALPLSHALHNLIPATLGNIVGGAVLVGMLMYRLERHTLPDGLVKSRQSVAGVTSESVPASAYAPTQASVAGFTPAQSK